jgi:hypothetical protein
MSEHEKRKDTRVNRKVMVCFEGEDFSIYSKTKDVSANGAFISTHYILTPGTEITLKLEEPPVEKRARVVHMAISGDESSENLDETGFGVIFI